jgi:Anti-sigma-K factor rskA
VTEPPSEMHDALLAQVLADPATWVEPSPALEESVVQAVAAAEAGRPRRRVALVAAVAAAVLGLIVVIGAVVLGDGAGADYRAGLVATDLALGASGRAQATQTGSGFLVVLDARGLPPLPDGEFYEVWLRDTDGILVPIGSFSASDGPVMLWSGVSPDDFPGITVTIEPADGDQASSGRRVLAGELRPT